MTPNKEWENIILPQFDKVTQDKLRSWRKRSLRMMWIGGSLWLIGGIMIGIFIGGLIK